MSKAAVDPSPPAERKEIPSGTLLRLQGSSSPALITLHSGMLEILEYPGDTLGLSEEGILAGSIRIGLIRGEAVCGTTGFEERPEDRSIRSIGNCVVSIEPIGSPDGEKELRSRKKLATLVLRSLQQRIESSIFLFKASKSAWRRLASIADAIALGFDWANEDTEAQGLDLDDLGGKQDKDFLDIFGDLPTEEPDALERIPPGSPNRYKDSLQDYSEALRAEAEDQDLAQIKHWDYNLFLDSYQEALKRFDEFEGLGTEQILEQQHYLFLKRLVRKQDALLNALFHQDEPSQIYVYQQFSKYLDGLHYWNRELGQAIREQAARLFADGGWVEKILARPEAHEPGRIRVFIHYLLRFALSCSNEMQKSLSFSLTRTYPVFNQLASYRSIDPGEAVLDMDETPAFAAGGSQDAQLAEEDDENLDAAMAQRIEEAQQKYQGLTEKILEYGEVDEEFAEQILDLLSQIKEMPDKLSTEKAAIQLRQNFTKMYWKLYEICFLKSLEDGLLSHPIPGIMLHFGLIDETLVSPKQLAELDQAFAQALEIVDPMPVMTLPFFLRRIYTGEILPSMSEMGETYPELLRRQKKLSPKERASSEIYDETPDSKIRYEVRNFAENLASLLAQSRRQALPILCTENLPGKVGRLFQSPAEVSMDFQQIRDRDFTLFFREVVIKHSLGTDLIRKEVLPYLVLYPVSGNRIMMWQDLDGTRKDSAGRFFMPVFYPERRDEALITLAAQFRWELCRSVAGHNWMDPVEGGLSGAYYDYIAYYKKNPNLLPAHKQALQEFIKRTRSDRDRFTEDYMSWALFEYENKIRLNPVARGIFHRFCPFPKDVREEMAKKPLYADLEMKYTNRTRKDILKLESRLKRFEKTNTSVPPEMRAYMEMLTG